MHPPGHAGAGVIPGITIGGIGFRIHLLFWLVMLGSVVTGHFLEVITLFGIVLIHELGHVSMARGLNWTVREVVMLPFGGVARMEVRRESVREEIMVILAGPLMNMLMLPFAWLFGWLGWWNLLWVDYFVSANLFIAGFNLLPVPPLDGGRLLLAVSYRFASYLRALRQAAIAGVLGAVALFLFSLAWGRGTGGIHLNLLLIACFLGVHNVRDWREIPYRFVLFLLRRRQHPESAVRYRPLLLSFTMDMRLRHLLEQMRWERYHLFVRFPEFLLGEEELLRFFFDENASQRKMRELLR
ncbi:MAG: hypothetical protein BAA01_09010 [Bacillus thermozeamaize]|jgi:stage IV sporulation protein FB|uniref:Peptidase M50 domain-containing protein n=1 Tax=Bacillus thermozeamaize TaxID=230954 RepID=A0A1Y3PIL7_9BACI|nr:MAG: hypothetical protein BAA01_09010 [Bacillus thermozeamaize]